jgi:hypothetical protein
MAEGAWVRGKTYKELADKWNIPLRRVAGYASEASNMVHLVAEPWKGEVVADNLGRLQRLADKAEQRGQLQAAVNACSIMGQMVGAMGGGRQIQVNTQVNVNREDTELQQRAAAGDQDAIVEVWAAGAGGTPDAAATNALACLRAVWGQVSDNVRDEILEGVRNLA